MLIYLKNIDAEIKANDIRFIFIYKRIDWLEKKKQIVKVMKYRKQTLQVIKRTAKILGKNKAKIDALSNKIDKVFGHVTLLAILLPANVYF